GPGVGAGDFALHDAAAAGGDAAALESRIRILAAGSTGEWVFQAVDGPGNRWRCARRSLLPFAVYFNVFRRRRLASRLNRLSRRTRSVIQPKRKSRRGRVHSRSPTRSTLRTTPVTSRSSTEAA